MLSSPISSIISIVDPSAVANNKQPFIRNFMLPVPDASCPAVLHQNLFHVMHQRKKKKKKKKLKLHGAFCIYFNYSKKWTSSDSFEMNLSHIIKFFYVHVLLIIKN